MKSLLLPERGRNIVKKSFNEEETPRNPNTKCSFIKI